MSAGEQMTIGQGLAMVAQITGIPLDDLDGCIVIGIPVSGEPLVLANAKTPGHLLPVMRAIVSALEDGSYEVTS